MSYLNDLLDRVVALQKEAMTGVSVTCDAVPYFFFTGESFPYFTNRINDIPITDDGSEVGDLNTPTVIMRLVIGHLTSGTKGEPESNLYTWLPTVKTYFNRRERLQSAVYLTPFDNLYRARCSNGGGLRAFQNDGIQAIQVGAELILRCECVEYIEQVYL